MKILIIKKCLSTVIVILYIFNPMIGQSVKIDGALKIENISLDNSSNDIVTRQNDQSYARRNASTFIGPQGSQGIPGNNGLDGPIGPDGIPGNGGVTSVDDGIEISGNGNLSMPYILNLSGHHIGEIFGGGIIYCVYDHGAHGLIASLHDLDDGNGADWGFDDIDIQGADEMMDGAANTVDIIAAGGLATEAAGLCDNFSEGGFTDWYLPSNFELKQLGYAVLIIKDVLSSDGDPATTPLTTEEGAPAFDTYWSSTETGSSSVFIYFTNGGSPGNFHNKVETYRVRAVRSF